AAGAAWRGSSRPARDRPPVPGTRRHRRCRPGRPARARGRARARTAGTRRPAPRPRPGPPPGRCPRFATTHRGCPTCQYCPAYQPLTGPIRPDARDDTGGTPERPAGTPEATDGTPQATGGTPKATGGTPKATDSTPETTKGTQK